MVFIQHVKNEHSSNRPAIKIVVVVFLLLICGIHTTYEKVNTPATDQVNLSDISAVFNILPD